MKKQILGLFLLFTGLSATAQYDYTPTGRNDVPVLGMQWGLTGGGFTSLLPNRDDIDADSRLDPQAMNFSYAAGVEGIYWFQRTFGVGGQVLYWMGGAAYTGKDSITKIKLTAKTDLTYIKVPVLFHFKSYNRYYPDRRTRFSAFFGPYVAVLNAYKDALTYKDDNGNTISKSSTSSLNFTSGLNNEVKGKLSSGIYNPLDIGIVAGMGVEVRLWRRTVLALNLRTDVGISNVENSKGVKITYDSDPMKEYDFNPWKDMYAKYTPANAGDVAAGWAPNRPATKNFSMGAFLTIRKYLAY
ncbi:MAG TPA: porin family protein [Chitinophagaceae bacterium]|nr:porin family protein [Chitinophagaceae bacterium]